MGILLFGTSCFLCPLSPDLVLQGRPYMVEFRTNFLFKIRNCVFCNWIMPPLIFEIRTTKPSISLHVATEKNLCLGIFFFLGIFLYSCAFLFRLYFSHNSLDIDWKIICFSKNFQLPKSEVMKQVP